jgi:hypothetical protein
VQAALRDLFRLIANLHKLRDADNSVRADAVAQKAAVDFHNAATEEVEKVLSKHGRKLLREQLDLMTGHEARVAAISNGVPIAHCVRRRRRPKRIHSAFTAFHRTRLVKVVHSSVDGCQRLTCSCLWPTMMGLPCRHLCAVNKGASLEDCSVRWLNAATRGYVDDVLFDFKSRPDTHPVVLKSPQADDWSVVSSAGRAVRVRVCVRACVRACVVCACQRE